MIHTTLSLILLILTALISYMLNQIELLVQLNGQILSLIEINRVELSDIINSEYSFATLLKSYFFNGLYFIMAFTLVVFTSMTLANYLVTTSETDSVLSTIRACYEGILQNSHIMKNHILDVNEVHHDLVLKTIMDSNHLTSVRVIDHVTSMCATPTVSAIDPILGQRILEPGFFDNLVGGSGSDLRSE